MSSRSRRRRLLTMREGGRIARFLTVGAAVAVTYAGLFLGLLEVGVARWQANGIAQTAAIAVQYVAHTLWTFDGHLRDRRQQLRFLGVIAFGYAFGFGVTTQLSPRLGWSDEVSAALVVFVLPVFNFLLYRLWVFTGRRP